jgi:hypothetical protein
MLTAYERVHGAVYTNISHLKVVFVGSVTTLAFDLNNLMCEPSNPGVLLFVDYMHVLENHSTWQRAESNSCIFYLN